MQKTQALINRIREKRGYLHPGHEILARTDPAFLESYNGLYESCLGKSSLLSIKVKEFIAIALLAQQGYDVAVELHMKRAMQNGATPQEIVEALEAATLPGGAPILMRGLDILGKIVGKG